MRLPASDALIQESNQRHGRFERRQDRRIEILRHREARRELAIFATRHPDFSEQRIRWIPFADPAKNKFLIANFDLAKSIA